MSADTRTEFFTKPNGQRLNVLLSTHGSAVGSVFYVPGYYVAIEESNQVKDILAHCESRRMNFVAFDYTAHGRSDGETKHLGFIDPYYNDARLTFREYAKVLLQDGPRIAVGHSIGGLSVHHMIQEMPEIDEGITIAAVKNFMKEGALGRRLYDAAHAKGIFKEGEINDEAVIKSPLGRKIGMAYRKDFLLHLEEMGLVEDKNGMPLPPIVDPPSCGITCIYGADDPATSEDDFKLYAARWPIGQVRLVRCESIDHPDKPVEPGKPREILTASHGLDHPYHTRIITGVINDAFVAAQRRIDACARPERSAFMHG